ncbi:hypothetical protein GCM10011371_33890 [Novosphingobium marinum]|uniref:Uncharacterized protein n=1 Tax=Novosphingobium marinum TaxID=1514948 RepID=A0A7Y9Y197_9SPHN|nr:hypothetical protein [Novosphingobium marinum]NYH97110.1 hypothetical protein [Novosphingobium marinum]GGC43670.1 hypothetical protein GCM10011371_33890 [Novosphingobium marinum]
MKNVIPAVLLSVSATLLPAQALAHGSEEPEHGGAVQMSGEIKVEFVPSKKGMTVYISEEDEPLAASGFNARLVVTTPAGQKLTSTLSPQSGNRFVAPGVTAISGSKVVVALEDKGSGAKSFATFRMK